MKSVNLILAYLIIITFWGCGVSKSDYELEAQKTATVGSPMLSYIIGTANMFDPHLGDHSAKLELVYSGKLDNIIKIDQLQYYSDGYDWYIEDRYTKHLEYDLSLSDVIKFKNYSIKVLSSDSNQIDYIITEYLNQREL